MTTTTTANSYHRVCPQCGKVAALQRRFCGGCRAVLVKPCPACAFANERDDVWCGGCGAGLQPARAATAVPGPPGPPPFVTPAADDPAPAPGPSGRSASTAPR